MFAHRCTVCDQRRLMFPGQIISIDAVDAGLLVRFTCWCGAEQAALTGHARRHAEAA